MDYLKYYRLETYLFGEVNESFRLKGCLTAEEFFCIVIWKANRAKSRIAKRIKAGGCSLEAGVKTLTGALHAAATHKERLRILLEDWSFRLPMASAILTVLYPDDFTIYDVRVCEQVKFDDQTGSTDFDKVWDSYQKFTESVKTHPEVSAGLSLRDRDRWLWGKSFYEQLRADVRNEFGDSGEE